jgi:murein DD-endopeptidase MepM/ murein hydrolase activator NlpD
MKKFFIKKKNVQLFMGALLFVILLQSFVIAKLYSEKDDKNYQVNLVKINTQKDSLDFFKLKNDLATVDNTVRTINNYLKAKNASNLSIEALSRDSLSSSVYLSNQSSRYSEYLVELEKRLQQVPVGHPINNGFLSSNFGMRKNPIPSKKILLASARPLAISSEKIEKDSAGNVINKSNVNVASKNAAPAEKDQMQFHKGIDYGVSYGSDVMCTATGKVIFAGQKSGYGHCVIISHGNYFSCFYTLVGFYINFRKVSVKRC